MMRNCENGGEEERQKGRRFSGAIKDIKFYFWILRSLLDNNSYDLCFLVFSLLSEIVMILELDILFFYFLFILIILPVRISFSSAANRVLVTHIVLFSRPFFCFLLK